MLHLKKKKKAEMHIIENNLFEAIKTNFYLCVLTENYNMDSNDIPLPCLSAVIFMNFSLEQVGQCERWKITAQSVGLVRFGGALAVYCHCVTEWY